jgi:hypothetical protein
MGVDAKVTSARVEAAITSGSTIAQHRARLTLTPVVQTHREGAVIGVAGVF